MRSLYHAWISRSQLAGPASPDFFNPIQSDRRTPSDSRHTFRTRSLMPEKTSLSICLEVLHAWHAHCHKPHMPPPLNNCVSTDSVDLQLTWIFIVYFTVSPYTAAAGNYRRDIYVSIQLNGEHLRYNP